MITPFTEDNTIESLIRLEAAMHKRLGLKT